MKTTKQQVKNRCPGGTVDKIDNREDQTRTSKGENLTSFDPECGQDVSWNLKTYSDNYRDG